MSQPVAMLIWCFCFWTQCMSPHNHSTVRLHPHIYCNKTQPSDQHWTGIHLQDNNIYCKKEYFMVGLYYSPLFSYFQWYNRIITPKISQNWAKAIEKRKLAHLLIGRPDNEEWLQFFSHSQGSLLRVLSLPTACEEREINKGNAQWLNWQNPLRNEGTKRIWQACKGKRERASLWSRDR